MAVASLWNGWLDEGIHIVKSFVSYMREGPSIYVIPGTKVAKIHVWHQGRLMAVYFPIDENVFDIEGSKYVEMDGEALYPPPVAGLDISFRPNHFNTTSISVYDSITDQTKTIDGDETFTF